MASPYKQFATEKNKELDGVSVSFGGFKLLLARAGGSNYKFARAFEKYIGSGTSKWGNSMSDVETAEALANVMVDSVVKGWENVTDDDGKAMKYDKKKMYQMFVDLPDLLQAVFDEAQKLENFRRAEVEADEGNSQSGSNGDTSTETSTKQ